MQNDDSFDEGLKIIVRSVEASVPPGLEGKVRAAAETRRLQPKFWFAFLRRPLILAALSGASAVLLAFLLIVPSFRGREETPITEIRTEFELADKNITIIFIQRSDISIF